MNGVSRREWLGAALTAPRFQGVVSQDTTRTPAPEQSPRAGTGAVGELYDPTVVGRPRERTAGGDNDEPVKQIEQRLRCTCGCTLDVFTCRTTDFTCTYSPEMHREVVALYTAGKSDTEIVQAFVAKYGEEVLMAPEPKGFNLAGYLVPGIVILAIGALVTWIIRRRMRRRAPAAIDSVPSPPASDATAEELERLERELEKIG